MIGIHGGWAYLSAAILRVWAGRVPGLEPTTIDDVYFGDHPDVPPYVAEDWHTSAAATERSGQWLQWATVELDQRELEADRAESLRLQAERPDLGAMSNEALLGRLLSFRPVFRRMFHQHINQSGAASVGPGILAQVCAAIGEPAWAMRLMAGLGAVDSAEPSYAMWELSRRARESSALTGLFDGGVDGLLDRASASTAPDVVAFREAFAAFLAEFGSRGANEWDLVARVWDLNPGPALAAVDRMRLAPDESSPQLENAAREAERKELADRVRVALAGNDEALGAFEVGLASVATFLPGRERSKTTIIRVLHEARLAALELGGRLAAAGRLDEPRDVFMLFVDELEEAVAGNLRDLAAEIPERQAYHRWLASLEPPFIINGQASANTTWPEKGSRPVAVATVGEVITGAPGCPGSATGRARVVLDPGDPTGLEPGDVLVAPFTDPAWTPLFVPAAAVVVDVGAMLSHAVIVSRELGIPCVPAAHDATRRIPDGALVRVDGDAGTVTVLELPA
jgi:pyruvate,water dikinase